MEESKLIANTTISTTITTMNGKSASDKSPLVASIVTVDSSTSESWKQETWLFLNLAIPTVIVQVTYCISPFYPASVVGRKYGPVYLSGFSLGNLTANLFTLSLLQGLFDASDTLSPQAFGAGNEREVGILAIRGYVASLTTIIPIAMLVALFMRPALVFIGTDEVAATLAAQWYQAYVLGLPFYALFVVSWKFLSAQEIVMPVVLASIIASGLVLPFALSYLTDVYGFVGSAYANCVYEASQALMLLLYLVFLRPHAPNTWPGLISGFRDAFQWKPLKLYLVLGAGGMLAQSEWIYWEVLSLMIGTLGVVPLAAHTIPSQILNITFMVPLGIGVALSVRLGSTLPHSARRAKRLAMCCFAASLVVIALMTLALYRYRYFIFGLFSTEPRVVQTCEQIWTKVCIFFFNYALFGVNAGIAIGLGMQWTLGLVNVVALCGVGLPGAWYFGIHVHRSLDVAWSWVYPPYVAMNVALLVAFVLTDWNAISRSIQIREGIIEPNGDEPALAMSLMDPSKPVYGAVDPREHVA